MKRLDTSSLRRSVIFFITIAIVVLVIITSVVMTIIQNRQQELIQQEYSKDLNQNIKHAIEHNINDYTFLTKRIIKTVGLDKYIKNEDREGLYAILKPRWDILKKENKYLVVMQVHLSNGKSFLRVHYKKDFGDDIATLRPMLQYIHKHHQFISGYETGRYATVYRIIAPIFDKENNYVGAFEIGINPNLILDAVYDTNGLYGGMFIKEEDLQLFRHKNSIIVNGYRLQSPVIPQMREIYKKLVSLNKLENNLHIKIKDKYYRSYLFILKDFTGEEKVKLIFFQDITNEGIFLDNILWFVILIIGLTLSILSWLIYKKILVYEKNVKKIYTFEKRYLQSIFDVTPNIMITINEEEIDSANPAMLEFFSYKTLEEFKKEHNCICDYFKDEHISSITDFKLWLDNILEHHNEIHNLKMIKNNKEYSFIVWAKSIKLDENNRAVITFIDISQQKELESKLVESKQIYTDFFEYTKSANIIYTTDDNAKSFKIKWLNASVERLENIKRKDIIGKNLTDIFKNADEFGIVKVLRDVYLTGRPQVMPLSMYKNDNCEVWRENYVFKLSNGDIVASYDDRSEEQKIQYKLTEAKEQFDQLMKYIPANIYIIEDNNIVYSNKSACDFFAKETLIGLKIGDLLHTNEAKIINNGLDRALKNRVFEDVIEMTNYLNEKRLFRILAFTIDNAKMNKLGLVTIDITEQYKDQHDIAKFKEIIEKSPISIVITDIDGNLEYVNSWFTKVTGYTYEEVIGQNSRILKSDLHSNQDYKELWNEITHNHVWSGIFKNIKKNGDEYWESAIIAPLRNSNGEITNFIGIKQEITEQVYLKKELKNKEEIMIAQSRHAAMGEMIGMIAHQWRQPISVIAMGANNMLVDIELEEMKEEAFKDQAESILKQTEYLSKTIDDFRNFFRPDKEVEEVKIEDIIEDAKKIIGKSLENNAITLSISYDDSYTIRTYSRELLQVYINLLKNSKESLVEYTDKNRYINVSISSDESFIITTVCDNGSGVDEKIINKIFDPYFSTKDEKNGTGLGLYMSKIIIEKHLHGKIEVSNDENGACFSVKVPKRYKNA